MSITADSILKHPNDKFGRGSFADVVAKILKSLPKNESTVVGLFGGWGSGKSHLLQMIRNLLNDDESTYIIEFNPWAHDTHWQLLEALFKSIEARLSLNSKSGGKTNKNIKKLSGALKKYGRQLAQNAKLSIGVPMMGVNLSSETTAPTFKHRHIQGAKEDLEKVLKDCQFKIVIEIDDLDRMEKSRICTFFKLMNLTLGMPNINFLVAADYEVVKEAISSEYGESAGSESALDKFIQVPLHLPPPPEIDLWKYTWELVQKVLKTAGIRYSKEDIRIVYDGLKRSFELFIKTPRRSKRLANALLAPLMTTGHDVDAYDLIHMEGIRLLLPDMYKIITDRRSAFLGVEFTSGLDEKGRKDVLGDDIKTVTESFTLEQQKRLKSLLKFLFPNMQAGEVNSGAYYSKLGTWKGDADQDRRVSARAYVQEYFAYAPGTTGIRESQVLNIFAAASRSYKEAVEAFSEYVTGENQDAFIEAVQRINEKGESNKSSLPNIARILAEHIDSKDMGTWTYPPWLHAVASTINGVDQLETKKDTATKAIHSQIRIDSRISLFYRLTKRRSGNPPIIDDESWQSETQDKLLKQCKCVLCKAPPVIIYRGAQLSACFEFLSSCDSSRIDEYRNHVLKEEDKLEAIINAFRGTWSDGRIEFADSNIPHVEKLIGVESIVSAIKDGRLSVTKPELEGKRRIYRKTYTAIQDFVMASGRASEAWGLEEGEH